MFNPCIVFLITIIFIFLQDCVVVVSKQLVYVSSIMVNLSLFMLLIKNHASFIKSIKNIYKSTPFKILVFFILWLIITSFVHGLDCLNILKKITLIYILSVVPAFIFPQFIFPKYLSYKKLLQFFVIAYESIMVYGILDFICRTFVHIKVPLYNIFCSRNYFSHILGSSLSDGINQERISSVFFEPSFYATFIFVFIPLTYVIVFSSIKIFKNTTVNFMIRASLFILTWICLFLTKSPIYIVLCFLYTGIFFYKNILHIIKKYLVFILPICIFIYLFVSVIIKSTDIIVYNDSIINNRIKNVLESAGNLDTLVSTEPSLATRIISIINTFDAAKKHFLVGVGYGNSGEVMYHQYANSSVPLTLEIIDKWMIVGEPSPNIFWKIFLFSGIFGVFLLYLFYIKTILYAYRIKKYFFGYELAMLNITLLISINYIIISFYWAFDSYPMMWFIFGILNSFIIIYNRSIRRKIKREVL